MASVAHLAAGAMCGAAYARKTDMTPAVAVPIFAALALAPDLDLIALGMGSAGTPLEHRVMTHSLIFSVVVGVTLGAGLAPKGFKVLAAALCFAALGSHGLLDSLTTNGPGPQLLWPFSSAPIKAAWQPIPGTRAYQEYFSVAAAPVLALEGLLCLPGLALAGWLSRPLGGTKERLGFKPREGETEARATRSDD